MYFERYHSSVTYRWTHTLWIVDKKYLNIFNSDTNTVRYLVHRVRPASENNLIKIPTSK